jgi:hypothetical protein
MIFIEGCSRVAKTRPRRRHPYFFLNRLKRHLDLSRLQCTNN